MEAPNVQNKITINVAGREFKFNILAYRKLSNDEITGQIDSFLRNRKSQKILKNYKGSEIIIPTIYGYDDPVNPYDRLRG